MKLLTLLVTNRSEAQEDRIIRGLASANGLLHNRNKIQIASGRRDTMNWLEVDGILPEFNLRADGPALYADMATVLAEHVLEIEEPRLLRHIIRTEFHYKQPADVESIGGYCEQILSGVEDWGGEADKGLAVQKRKEKIAAELQAFLEEHTELHWDGFVRFRLHAYKDELRDVVEYAVDEFVMDRQYQEFISLLQYFVYIQESKVPLVHLIHKGGNEFELLDDQMQPIETDENETMVTVEMLEKDVNFEDMIVSTLITISPEQIHIHTREPNTQVIKTIRQIFENRVKLCGYCRFCHDLDLSGAAEYNKR